MTEMQCRLGRTHIAQTPEAVGESVALYCQFRRYLINKYRSHVQAARLLVEANVLLGRANQLSIAAHETGQLDLRIQSNELRAQAVEYLTQAMRVKAQAP